MGNGLILEVMVDYKITITLGGPSSTIYMLMKHDRIFVLGDIIANPIEIIGFETSVGKYDTDIGKQADLWYVDLRTENLVYQGLPKMIQDGLVRILTRELVLSEILG